MSKKMAEPGPSPAEECPYKISPERLNDLNSEKDMNGLKEFGGVAGLAAALASDAEAGLSTGKAGPHSVEEHVKWFGANKFKETAGKNFLVLVYENMQDPIIILLIAAAAVSTILGSAIAEERKENHWIEGVAIWVAVILVTMVGAGNDYQKDLQFRKLNAQKDLFDVTVIRDGSEMPIKNNEVVVGDVLFLTTGDKVIADGIVIHVNGLIIDEASLTGEADPIKKNVEHDPWCRSGTKVTEGSGRILITAVGRNSEWGKILGTVQEAGSDETPLQEKLGHLAGVIGKIGFAVAAACFIALLIKWCVQNNGFPIKKVNDNGPVQFFLYCVTIIVVSIPEGLPLAVTISLAYSMRKMMLDNNFVRVLAACETMGGATAICSDKTGTLTENRMTVVEGWFAGTKMSTVPGAGELKPDLLHQLEMNMALNGKAYLIEHGGNEPVEFMGNRTDCALLMLMRSWGHSYKQMRDEQKDNIVELYGFSSEKKMASVLVRLPDRLRLYNKGAAEWVLKKCTNMVDEYGSVVPMTEALRSDLLQGVVVEMASRGLRCICLTYTDFPLEDPTRAEDFFKEAPDENLTACAVVGIKDPVRKEVPAAVATCQHAGIMVRMVTGDNIHTAKHIARECGILSEEGVALEGPVFRAMTAMELSPILDKLQVLARSSPHDKFMLVKMLKEKGEVVAVTGDGTNDAPALKESDVGLAMGIAGTEVAKEAADIVILDDNFSSIVKSVLWGRSVFNNIRKFLMFQLTVNFVALVISFVGVIIGSVAPLNVLQLLWVNLIMDTMGALALATEQPNIELLDEKPYGREEPLINYNMWKHIFVQGMYQMFWMFFCLYALPIIWEDRYGIVKRCDWYDQNTTTTYQGQSLSVKRCEEQLIRHSRYTPTNAFNTCSDLTSCNLKLNPCGFPSLKAIGNCSLSTWWPNGVYPRDLKAAYCKNGTSGCPPHDTEKLLVNYNMIHKANEKLDKQFEKAQHYSREASLSVLFNIFIFAQVANEINARRINDELTIFQGLHNSPIFLSVIFITIGLQAIIINFLGLFFKVIPLDWDEWLVTMAIGAGSIPVSLLTRIISKMLAGHKFHFRGRKASRHTLSGGLPATKTASGRANSRSSSRESKYAVGPSNRVLAAKV